MLTDEYLKRGIPLPQAIALAVTGENRDDSYVYSERI